MQRSYPLRPERYDLDYLERVYAIDTQTLRGLDGQCVSSLTMNPLSTYFVPVAMAVSVTSSDSPERVKAAWFMAARIDGCNQWTLYNHTETVKSATQYIPSKDLDPMLRSAQAVPVVFSPYCNVGMHRKMLTFTIGNPHPTGDKIDVVVRMFGEEHETLPLPTPRVPLFAALVRIPAFSAAPSVGEGLACAWARLRAKPPRLDARTPRRGGCDSAEVACVATCRSPGRTRERLPALHDAGAERLAIAAWILPNEHGHTSARDLSRAILDGDHLVVLGDCEDA